MDTDDFIDSWDEQADSLLTDALVFLSQQDRSPLSDGVLGRWVEQLCGFRFTESHLAPIVQLLGKPDPLLVEAGIVLATGATQTNDNVLLTTAESLTRLFDEASVDPWVVRAISRLFTTATNRRDPCFVPLFRCLVSWCGSERVPTLDTGIMRNMYIDPRADLLSLFEQNALQVAQPAEQDLVYLPLLEEGLGTEGWDDTVAALCRSMGFDPAEHLAVLGR